MFRKSRSMSHHSDCSLQLILVLVVQPLILSQSASTLDHCDTL